MLGLFAAVVIIFWLVNDSIVIADRANVAERVTQRFGDTEVQVTRFPGGLYLGIVAGEGELAVRCRNGETKSLGYITGFLGKWRSLRAEDCDPNGPLVLD
jgi:hypothetical protein